MKTNLHSSESNPEHLTRLGDLTRAYARFARNAAGLGNVLGGVMMMAMWIISNLVSLPLWSLPLLALFPVVWIVLKELLRHRYYLRHGLAREAWCATHRHRHIWITGYTALVSLMIIAVVGYTLWDEQTVTWHALGYITFVVAMPVCTWFYMRTTEEYVVGIILFCQAAVIIAGGHYSMAWWWSTVYFLFAALFAIAVGVKQHLDYRKIDRELRGLQHRT